MQTSFVTEANFVSAYSFVAADFSLKPAFMIAAAAMAVCLAIPGVRRRCLLAVRREPDNRQVNLIYLYIACGVYFLTSAVCKFTQFQTRGLAGNDFWLLEDMFRSMAQGEPYITRFAHQAIGPLQHGGIHAYLTPWLLTPAIAMIGATATAILLIPLCFTAGGYLIGRSLAHVTSANLVIVGLPVAFWMSEWTNRSLIYDTHPEALYVPLGFIVCAATTRLHRSFSKLNWLLFISAWLALAGVKQDALFFGLSIWALLLAKKKFKVSSAVVSLIALVGLFALMTKLIAAFRAGLIGPDTFSVGGFTAPITRIVDGAVNLNGHSLSSLGSIVETARFYLGDSPIDLFKRALRALFFSQFTAVTLIAPWLWARKSFWVMVAPFAVLIGLMNNQVQTLATYNAIIPITLFWLCLCTEAQDDIRRRKPWLVLASFAWIFCFCGVHGGTAPSVLIESASSKRATLETSDFLKTVDGPGIVSSRLLKDVDKQRIWGVVANRKGDLESEPPDFVSWIVFPKKNQSYEFEANGFSAWRSKALDSGKWTSVSADQVELLKRSL